MAIGEFFLALCRSKFISSVMVAGGVLDCWSPEANATSHNPANVSAIVMAAFFIIRFLCIHSYEDSGLIYSSGGHGEEQDLAVGSEFVGNDCLVLGHLNVACEVLPSQIFIFGQPFDG